MPKKTSTTLAPKNIGVKTIPTDSLLANPHNPRRLFDRQPMTVLKDSIAKVGILVPLTVYWSRDDKHFVILDGERRWLCAKSVGLSKVPVNQVAEPDIVQNIVTMFQIHKFREDWELMPTALKLEVLITRLEEKNEKKLAELTGLDSAVVTRCKKLLTYSKEFQDLMLDEDPSLRVKADFFIELYVVINDRFVNKMEWFSKEIFTRRMLQKYLTRSSGLRSVTDFRVMKQYINNARQAGKDQEISSRLKKFMVDDTLTMDYLVIKAADVSANAKKILGSITRIEEAIRDLDVNEFYGEEELWIRLENLLKLIRAKLFAAGRRLKE